MTAKSTKTVNYPKIAQKIAKTALSGKIANVCVTVCVYNAQEWIYMFSPIQTAHGP